MSEYLSATSDLAKPRNRILAEPRISRQIQAYKPLKPNHSSGTNPKRTQPGSRHRLARPPSGPRPPYNIRMSKLLFSFALAGALAAQVPTIDQSLSAKQAQRVRRSPPTPAMSRTSFSRRTGSKTSSFRRSGSPRPPPASGTSSPAARSPARVRNGRRIPSASPSLRTAMASARSISSRPAAVKPRSSPAKITASVVLNGRPTERRSRSLPADPIRKPRRIAKRSMANSTSSAATTL